MAETSGAPIKLGFVGLSAGKQWAAQAHLPYLQQSQGYKITGLLNSSKASASKSAEEYKLDATCYDSVDSLVADSNVDTVAVSVKVPVHAEMVLAALEANKNVFCEWPLARNLSEAERIVSLAREKQVKTMVGLQARQSPAVRKVKELVEAGELGTILGTTMLGAGRIFGPVTMDSYLYLNDVENGANLLTIPFGHAVDALCYALGEFRDVKATLANNRPKLQLLNEEGKFVKHVEKTAHDYISVSGPLEIGGVATVVYEGGSSLTGKDFYWEIKGTKGNLVLEGPAGHVQMVEPKLTFKKVDGSTVEDLGLPVPTETSYNVGKAWDAFSGQASGTYPTFEEALVRHRMLDAIYRSFETGKSQSYVK